MFRIHLLALPNASTTKAYELDGFANATVRFAKVLKRLGHHVILYGGETNDAPVDELVTVITDAERAARQQGPYQHAPQTPMNPLWQLANPRMAAEIQRRKQPRDLICTIGGLAQRPIFDANADLLTIEYQIGYPGSCTDHRIFQSVAWQHHTYGQQGLMDRYFDDVIPGAYDVADFPFEATKDDYYFFCGRLVPFKGVGIACEIAAAAGKRLVVSGHGPTDVLKGFTGVEFVGAADAETRNALMSKATAVLCPTRYIEPFNQVAIEAQLCGTPVITTPFGGFTETVAHGVSGYHCHLKGDFLKALDLVKDLNPTTIRQRAESLYSEAAVAPQYQRYFERVSHRWDDGWHTRESTL